LIGVVIRNFCSVAEIIAWADKIVRENLRWRRCIRKGDPGKIVIVGYSSGPRNNLYMEWANNVDFVMGEGEEDRITTEMCWVMALFWNLCKVHLPEEIQEDVVEFLFPRMDFEQTQTDASGLGDYTLRRNGVNYEFPRVELAPPAGVFAANYSRAIHYEDHPHKFAASWTLTHTKRPGVGPGGNFYFSEYGIKVVHVPDGLIAWIPRQYHGTSIFDVGHLDDDWLSTGVALVTSSKL
ncbi:hypothetical protein BDN72DRAFT_739086, partial [Pluteus cervinus]